MILDGQLIPVLINKRNIEWYKSKGYNVKLKNTYNIKPNDLQTCSAKEIKIMCDYCGKIYNKKFVEYYKQNKEGIIKKDCCYNCRHLKQKESCLKIYGVSNPNKLKEIREKSKLTTKEKYGVDFYFQTEEFKNKYKKTMNEKYGVDNAFQANEIKEKIKKTNLKKYGVKHVLQNKNIIKKAKQTMIKRYGVDNATKHPDFLEKALNNSRETIYKNNSGAISRQQIYISEIIGGILNYPIDKYLLDIAFPEEYIYVECDFSGHELPIILGYKTEEEFKDYEKRRYYYLKNRMWRMIRIISTNDLLPKDNIIKDIIQIGRSYLNENHSWIKFNIDDLKIERSIGCKYYDYGELFKI